MPKLSLFLIFLVCISFISALPSSQGSPIYHETNYSEIIINETSNNTLLWDGNAWSDTRWLDIDGGNVNTNVNLGNYNLRLGNLISNSNGDLGANLLSWNDLYLDGVLTDGTYDRSVADIQTSYSHAIDNTQAHSDYLINNGNDTMTGVLTNYGVNPSSNKTYNLGANSNNYWKDLFLEGRLKSSTASVSIKELNNTAKLTTNGTFITSETDPIWTSAKEDYWNMSEEINTTILTNQSFKFFNGNNAQFFDNGVFDVSGNFKSVVFGIVMNFHPNVTDGGLYGFYINPNIHNTGGRDIYGIHTKPTYLSTINQSFTTIYSYLPAHKVGYKDDWSIIEEVNNPRTFVNDNGWFYNNGIILGDSANLFDVGGGELTAYEENLITLKGGVGTEIGYSSSPIQRGLKFIGFGNLGTNSIVEAIRLDGGIINMVSDSGLFKWGADEDVLMGFDGTNFNINMTNNGAVTIQNMSGLGKIRALEYATSTPKDSEYSLDDKYIDSLPSLADLLDENGKIVRGALPMSQTTWLEKDEKNCHEVGTGEYWYCYDIEGYESCSFSELNITLYGKGVLTEITREECGTKEVNVTLVETQAFENTIMIAELLNKINLLEDEVNRTKSCLSSARDFDAYKLCVGGIGVIE